MRRIGCQEVKAPVSTVQGMESRMESLVVFLHLIPDTGGSGWGFVSWLIWVWIMTWLGRLGTANAGGQVLPGPVPGPEELIDSFASPGLEGSPGAIDARSPARHRGIGSLMESYSNSVIARRVSFPNQADDVAHCPLVVVGMIVVRRGLV